jgi:phosphate transport system permease protein
MDQKGVAMSDVLTSPPERRPSDLRSRGLKRHSDRLFTWLLLAAGASVLLILAAMVTRTVLDARPVFEHEGILGFFFGDVWHAGSSRSEFTGTYGALPFIFGTLFTSAIAVTIALPMAIGVSLYINFYAPAKLRNSISYTVEVLAAIPSVIFGLWGLWWFVPNVLQPFSNFVSSTLGSFIPFFSGPVPNTNYFHAGVVLAIMILPIITAITREVMAATPPDEIDAGYGLGATKSEVLRKVVLPRSFAGIVGATMLGLGRALGETLAVLMLIGSSQGMVLRLFSNGDTLASHIAATFQDAAPEALVGLMGMGVGVLVGTMGVNLCVFLTKVAGDE